MLCCLMSHCLISWLVSVYKSTRLSIVYVIGFTFLFLFFLKEDLIYKIVE